MMARRDATTAEDPQTLNDEPTTADAPPPADEAPARPPTTPARVEQGSLVDGEEPPPYYIATEPLFIDDNPFARAHNAGDRVPADHVERYGWAGKVRHPDPDPATTPPETRQGQATTEGKGDA
ncbi:hypothetical protein [Sphaerisporangium sp. NPDC051011]|uniref:hypothetical protein n=1 Tax=Sphaerisporangium sp. NPDC051011 TaxID=3155792 RepID=UPI0033DF571F